MLSEEDQNKLKIIQDMINATKGIDLETAEWIAIKLGEQGIFSTEWRDFLDRLRKKQA